MSTFIFYVQNFLLKDECTIFFSLKIEADFINYLSYVDLGNIVPFKTEVLIGMTRHRTLTPSELQNWRWRHFWALENVGNNSKDHRFGLWGGFKTLNVILLLYKSLSHLVNQKNLIEVTKWHSHLKTTLFLVFFYVALQTFFFFFKHQEVKILWKRQIWSHSYIYISWWGSTVKNGWESQVTANAFLCLSISCPFQCFTVAS